ncbi:MAG: tRNA pseudouridine(55) synthase TruB [Candidatus Sericytochromatia bacterium]
MLPLARWLVIDKPAGCTSHDVVAQARRRLGLKRIGHSGTLDPDATGVMLLALGKATRLIPYLPGGKAYRALVRLGRTTDSYDSSGITLSEAPVPELDILHLDGLLNAFRGQITQQPPMVSARSFQGQRLYSLHRQGIDVPERPSRQVEIAHLELVHWEPPMLTLDIQCSAGTYIRSIAHDLGQKLGCGACLERLERTFANGMTLAEAGSLEDLRPLSEVALPGLAGDAPLQHLMPYTLPDAESVAELRQGKTLPVLLDLPEGETLRLYTPDGLFAAIGEMQCGSVQPRLLLLEPA